LARCRLCSRQSHPSALPCPPATQRGLAPGGRSGAVAFSAAACSLDGRIAAHARASGAGPGGGPAPGPAPDESAQAGAPGTAGFLDRETLALAGKVGSCRRFSAAYKTWIDPLVCEALLS
jgi:hypothetical protein